MDDCALMAHDENHHQEGSLLNSCYKLLYGKCERGEQNWMTSVKQLLQMYGFGDVWLDQIVTKEKEFIREFEIRIKDCKLQTWSAKIKTVPNLKYY